MTTEEMLKRAKTAKKDLAVLSTADKNRVLRLLADSLLAQKEKILDANAVDVQNAVGRIGDVMIDRLRLTETRIQGMAQGIYEVIDLPDPVGRELTSFTRPNGLKIKKVSVPFGVIAIIYESRPNVTSDAVALTIKSGNVPVLRSGKDAYQTVKTIVDIFKDTLAQNGFNPDFVNLPEDASRASAEALLHAKGYVDLLIPRGGKGLIQNCVENATVPIIETGTGICHLYVDDEADLDKALAVVVNAKTSRPSVCNALECCLVNEKIAPVFLPMLKKALVDARALKNETPVELRLDEKALSYIDGVPADEKDYDTEFLSYVLAVKTVKDVDEAIAHIADHSTGHSDGIITENTEKADKFVRAVDSAAVYVNASTRFTDGGEFGLGCEIGISTQKLHARGPMGLCEMTTYKYVVEGNGQVR